MRVITSGVLIMSLLLFSCGFLDEGCGEECSGPSGFFISCPGTKEGCMAKKKSMGCNKFSFNENKRACKVADCPDNCFLSGLEIFKKEEFETDYSYVEIFTDPKSDTQLTVEWFNFEEEE
jgi:hypothetical protein